MSRSRPTPCSAGAGDRSVRLVFAGTPDVALPSLHAIASGGHRVVAVVTRPDRPVGRGRRQRESAVKQWAIGAGVEVLQPERASDPDFIVRLGAIAPDCCPVVAYGALLPPEALAIPALGWCNLHFSLLPRWRGAAPVQHALINGDDVTGATTFEIVEALDAGPVYGVCTVTVRSDDTAGTLLDRLAESGAPLLASTLDAIESGDIRPRPQPADGITFAPKISVADARIDWARPAFEVDRRIRGCIPQPGAWTTAGVLRVKVGPVRLRSDVDALASGELVVGRREVLVGTATHPVELVDVQPAARPVMPAVDWARGLRDTPASLD